MNQKEIIIKLRENKRNIDEITFYSFQYNNRFYFTYHPNIKQIEEWEKFKKILLIIIDYDKREFRFNNKIKVADFPFNTKIKKEIFAYESISFFGEEDEKINMLENINKDFTIPIPIYYIDNENVSLCELQNNKLKRKILDSFFDFFRNLEGILNYDYNEFKHLFLFNFNFKHFLLDNSNNIIFYMFFPKDINLIANLFTDYGRLFIKPKNKNTFLSFFNKKDKEYNKRINDLTGRFKDYDFLSDLYDDYYHEKSHKKSIYEIMFLIDFENMLISTSFRYINIYKIIQDEIRSYLKRYRVKYKIYTIYYDYREDIYNNIFGALPTAHYKQFVVKRDMSELIKNDDEKLKEIFDKYYKKYNEIVILSGDIGDFGYMLDKNNKNRIVRFLSFNVETKDEKYIESGLKKYTKYINLKKGVK